MTIRILYIVAALIAAVWISYKIELSRGWTVFFTLLVSAAVGFLATILFMAGDGRFISKVLMTEMSYYYTSNWNDWVGSDLFSYCSIAIVLACIWLV